jgi:hypothetical protein
LSPHTGQSSQSFSTANDGSAQFLASARSLIVIGIELLLSKHHREVTGDNETIVQLAARSLERRELIGEP